MTAIDRRSYLGGLGLAIAGLAGSGSLGARAARAAAGASAALDGAMATAARGDAAAGKPLARLSLNENPYGPSPAAVAALRNQFANLSRYTGAEYEVLMRAIAERERLPREQIVLGEILEPLGTHLSLQGGSGGEFSSTRTIRPASSATRRRSSNSPAACRDRPW
jgi:hypothetical protein